MTAPGKWHESLTEINTLAHWLVKRGEIIGIKDLLAYYERPWRWEDERAQMLSVKSGDLFVCRDCDDICRPTHEDQTMCEDCWDRRREDALLAQGADK